MCVLFLRGAQTIGEIKSRSYRIYEFKDLAETKETLDGLINTEESRFVIKLPKESGRENRYTHLFCGEPQQQEQVKEQTIDYRISSLETEVFDLKEMVLNLQKELNNFKKSFD